MKGQRGGQTSLARREAMMPFQTNQIAKWAGHFDAIFLRRESPLVRLDANSVHKSSI
jgi:hypothetical protein